MKFQELVSYFEKLEATSSRLALIDILVELFQHLEKKEVDQVIYLLQGRVAPFYALIEIGMADKMVAQAIALAYDSTKEQVIKEDDKIGDMGLVAAEFGKKGKDSGISISDVFEALTEISHVSGDGSVEKKIGLLSDILKKVDGNGAKHLVRIPLGNNRLGVGDPTILDGLALTFLGDKTQRKVLENAYNETSDLGLIGKTVAEKGIKEVEKLGLTVGRPIRSELCERLPNVEKVMDKMDTGEGVHVTPKYDGFRVQVHKNGDEVQMFSRNLETMTHMFPELIEGARQQVKVKTAILDCEALAYNAESEEFYPFQETTKRRRKHNIEEVAKTLPLKAFVFDILYADGESLIDKPLKERMAYLDQVVKEGDILLKAPGQIITQAEKLQTMLDDSISKGLEGVVIKKLDSPYEAGGRNFNWVKLKRHNRGELSDTIDCVILGYIFGRGKRTAFGVGALLVGLYDKKADEFVSVSKIGTGLSDDEWRSIKEQTKGQEMDHKPARVRSILTPSVWVKPSIVIEVLADEITRSPIHTAGTAANTVDEAGKVVKNEGYALRFPRLVKFREDKSPEDSTSVEELIEMYDAQGKKS
jgi:DNA ligase-1